MPKRKTPTQRALNAERARSAAHARAAARAHVAKTAATEYVTLWGDTARLPVDALPVLPQPRTPKPKVEGNPCVALYGSDPAGRKCKACAHLCYFQQSARWYKCDLRKLTHGPGSDHRVNWPACAKFQERAADDERK